MKFDVTFTFVINGKECDITKTVYALTDSEAIVKARNCYHPPVPDDIKAVATPSGAGGKRDGAGVKEGSKRTASPRNVRKQIRWTEKEWAQIESDAEATGQEVADYQREKLLR